MRKAQQPSFLHFIRLIRPLSSLQLSPVQGLGRIMAKPILLSVDDDSDVLRAIERDLRSKYGAEYRVMASGFSRGSTHPFEAVEGAERQCGPSSC